MDNTCVLLLAGACGLGLLCALSLAVGFVAVFGSPMRLFGGRPAPQHIPTPRRPDLRARAQGLDFDAAVTRHSAQNAPPAAQGARPPDLGPLSRVESPRRQSRFGREFSDDELFGGVLDDDGDGYPDR
ncbi:MAG: hypothetical protein ACUVSX_11500 [Aggregatilineales bacterium]